MPSKSPAKKATSPVAPRRRDVLAAGAVIFRKGGDVLLVHRPSYHDWSFPKGKLDRGEHLIACAVREVAEETGVDIRLGRKLASQHYQLKDRRNKIVHYWVARALDDDISGYKPNSEIDQVRWVSPDEARKLLTYAHDRDTLDEALKKRKKTKTLVILRHAQARSRKAWRKDDRIRPLLKVGTLEAEKLVPLLAAYDVTKVATSTSMRCLQTVLPYANLIEQELTPFAGLSEEVATDDRVAAIVEELISTGEPTVVCSHRPVLPLVFDALGLDRIKMEPADFVVVHHRKGKISSIEHYSVTGVNP